MKILFSTDTVSQERGGIEGYCYRLAKELSKNHSVSVLCCAAKSDIINGVNYINGRRYESNPILNLASSMIAMKGTHTKSYDAIICSSWRTAMIAWLINRKTSIPYYVQVHGNDLLESGSSALRMALERGIRRRILSDAKGIIANSNYTKDLCLSVLNNRSVVVIHPSISYEPAFEKPATCSPIERGGLSLFSLGRLEERKGIQLVLKALKKLQEEGFESITYRIGGTGPFEGSLKRLASELGLAGVTFLGRISEEEKAREYSACDLFVMPSFHDVRQGSIEGFGIVFVEANMYGKPVVASRSGGIPDAVIDGVTGFLVPELNVDALADVLRAFAEGSVTIDSAELERWASQHTAEAVAARYIELLSTDLL